MSDCGFDFVFAKRVAEGRHEPREGANWSALVGNGSPVPTVFTRSKNAIGEIRQRRIESDLVLRAAAAIFAMTGSAGIGVDITAIANGRRRRTQGEHHSNRATRDCCRFRNVCHA